jgi:hypothetical protein
MAVARNNQKETTMLKHRNTINWSLIDKKWHEDRNERIVKLAATLDAQKGGNSMSREINGQTRWSPEQFGAFAAGTAEGADPTKTACPVCKGTGLDWNNTWPNGMASHCEECDGYGEVTK